MTGQRGPLVLAHRGACTEARENTLEAFARARELGADGVELDVHRTRDDALVVHHDASAHGVGLLAERSLREIHGARPEVPTLGEALDECAGMLVNIELKNLPGDGDFDPGQAVADLLVALLASRADRDDDVLVSSFNLDTVDRVHHLAPWVPTGWLTMVGLALSEAVAVAHDRGHAAVHPDARGLDDGRAESMIAGAHALALRVHVWTVDDAARIRALADAGVDGVITDELELALRTLGRASA